MSKAILLADDSVTIQKVIELTFMDQDYQIEAVGSGDEALRHLDGGVPDLVIADVHMPGASGFDVARRSKELSEDTPVLLLVGTFEPFDEGDFRTSGADDVLKKPFDSQELLRLVAKLLPAEAAAEEPAAVPVEEDDTEAGDLEAGDLRDTGVFSLDDDAFDGSSEVQPPPDLLSGGAAPAAGLAWDLDDDTAAEVVEEVEAEAVAVEAEVVAAESVEAAAEPLEAYEAEAPEPELPETAVPETEPPGAVADEPAPVPAAHGEVPAFGLSDADVERIAVRVAELVGEKVARDIAWEVLPDLAEVVIKERLRELESQVE